ncbi:MAG: hypothetical protein PHE93_05860 [Clostridia bacterium]|nr:hypothetical protein [Clostridia bacterium]
MKNIFKKLGVCLLAISIITICLCCFVACNNTGDANAKTVTITIGETAYTLDTNSAYLHDALIELKEKGKISHYEFSESTYGIYITSISDLDLSVQNSFIAVYHNIDDASLIDYTEYASAPVVLNNTTYNPSYVGVSTLPLENGAKYLLKVSTY